MASESVRGGAVAANGEGRIETDGPIGEDEVMEQ